MSAAREQERKPEAEHKPRLLFFHSRTDGASRRAEAHLAQVLQAHKNHDAFVLHRIEMAERPDLAERMKIDVPPAILVLQDKRIRGRLEQPKGVREIKKLLTPWLR